MRRIRIKRGRQGLWCVGLISVIVCAVVTYKTKVMDIQLEKKNQTVNALESEQAGLEREKEELLRDKVITKEDIEKEARDKLGLVYPDEIIVKPE